MNVLIPSAGIGSRLGHFTKNFNKAMIQVGSKPVISHIIESYPISTKFIIALGYKGSHIKEFLTLAYPKRKFSVQYNLNKYRWKNRECIAQRSHV